MRSKFSLVGRVHFLMEAEGSRWLFLKVLPASIPLPSDIVAAKNTDERSFFVSLCILPSFSPGSLQPFPSHDEFFILERDVEQVLLRCFLTTTPTAAFRPFSLIPHSERL